MYTLGQKAHTLNKVASTVSKGAMRTKIVDTSRKVEKTSQALDEAKDAAKKVRKVNEQINDSAKNAANQLRLRTQLSFQEAGYLSRNGKLTEKAIKESKKIDLKDKVIQNPKVVKCLTKDGSHITDWAKFKTEAVKMPNGQRLEIHYYKNTQSGKVDYKTVDYKVKGEVKQ